MPYIKKDTQFTPIARLILGYATHTDLAEAIGVSRPTAAARLARPEMFTLAELSHCRTKLHIPMEEIIKAIHL